MKIKFFDQDGYGFTARNAFATFVVNDRTIAHAPYVIDVVMPANEEYPNAALPRRFRVEIEKDDL